MSYTKVNSCSQFLHRCRTALFVEADCYDKREGGVQPEQPINYLFKHATLQQLEAVFKSREFGYGKSDTILAACCDGYSTCFIAIESIASAALRLLPSHKEVVRDMLDFKPTKYINQQWESFKHNSYYNDGPSTVLGTSSLEDLLSSPVHPEMKAFFTELNEGLHIDENLLPAQLPCISFTDKYKWIIQYFTEGYDDAPEDDMCVILHNLNDRMSITFCNQIINASSKDIRDLVFSKIDEENNVFTYCFKRAHKHDFDRVLQIFVSKLSSQDISQLKTELGQSLSYQSLRERPVNELAFLEKKQLSIYRLMDSNSN